MVASESDGLLKYQADRDVENTSLPSRRTSIRVNRRLLLFSGCLLAASILVSILVPILRHPPRRHQQQPGSSPSSSLPSLYHVGDPLRFDTDEEKGRYTATQFISFTINTLGGSKEHGECKHRRVDPTTGTCYLGNFNITEDVYHRLKIVQEVLIRLRNDVLNEEGEVDRSSSVLKIFMLPEFFWRGPNGAYSVRDMYSNKDDDSKNNGVLIQISDRLREMVADEAFEDYLFVLGTVIAAQSLNDDSDGNGNNDEPWEQENATASDVLYYNLAPVFKGGTSTNRSHYYVFQKNYISGADFLSGTGLPNPSNNSDDLHKYSGPWQEMLDTLSKRGTTLVEDNLIEINGIRIGLEICLDHRLGVLWDVLQKRHNSELVHVQLITSAGMAIERGPNPIVPGGVVYLCDGEASSAACLRTDTGQFDPETVCRESPDGLKHIPITAGDAGYSHFFPLAACFDMEKSDLLAGYYSLYQTQGCAYSLKLYGIDVMDEFTYYPPSLEIYPTVDLPKKK